LTATLSNLNRFQ